MRYKILTFILILGGYCNAQNNHETPINVLFIGNSYVYFNNLPDLVKIISASCGDFANFGSSAQGGFTLEQHTNDSNTINLIKKGYWDFVILQEQSQLPSLNFQQVKNQFYPYAVLLDSLVHKYNASAKTVFYMTWGRKFGDPSNCNLWKPVCTYDGMDSLIALRYNLIADSCDALVSPVGRVWNYLIKNNPDIELYDPDGGHPSFTGSYVAACCFYTIIFSKDPMLIKFNGQLAEKDANIIKSSVKKIVYDHLGEWSYLE